MKYSHILIYLLLYSTLSFGQAAKDPAFLPPFNFRVDSTTLLATWEAPKLVLLDEDFEGDAFPPEGWSDTTLGMGWQCEAEPQYHWWWMVPEHSGKQAQVNDDIAPYDNDGSMDFLYTPELDLTVADSFRLRFDSYFDGAYGQTAFIKYSLDSGANWQVLEKMEANLDWQQVEIDLSLFSGPDGESDLMLAFYTNDKADNSGWWASGWAVDNIQIYSGKIPNPVNSYKLFLDTTIISSTTSTFYQYSFEYNTIHTCAVMAFYNNYVSDPVEQTVHSTCLPKPTDLVGSAPDEAAILTWSPPIVMHDGPAKSNNRDFGDVLRNFPSPQPITSCYGICDDGTGLWISDPNRSGTTIFKVTYDGENTGGTITLSQGQSWIGDMVSDGIYLYCCLIGGSNRIGKVYLPTGQIVTTIGGDFTVESQMGLAADFENEEFYIGGWNSNMIWRTHFNGNTISTCNLNNVSGLAWHPTGGPDAEGSLWVTVQASPSWITEIDPNSNWANIQAFIIPGGEPYAGAGIEIKTDGYYKWQALWVCNQVENKIYLVDLIEMIYPGPRPKVPDNLLGFDLYQDGEFQAYIDYTAPDSCGYVDPIDFSEKSFIEYEVSALYDLTPYGFPGDTGESLRDGPAMITSCCFNILDFYEDWSEGWAENFWKVTDENWEIAQELGNDAPAVIFSPDSIIQDYRDSLQTYMILAYPPGFKVVLSYDISLSSVVSTGNEKLEVLVYDYFNSCWNTVKAYDNAAGSFGWISDTADITGLFNDDGFRIRFLATGENSADIEYWAVDNISARFICPPPTGVTAELINNEPDSVLVTWEEPDPPIAKWKQWDDGLYDGGIGFGTGKESWFGAAAHWTPEMLQDYKDASITAIGFIPGDLSACFKVAIWSGDNKTPVYLQATGNLVQYEWNIITLDTPQKMDITKDLYVGYKVSTYTGYPMSVDDGPAIDGFGNLFQNGPDAEWLTILDFNPDLDYNWNIKAYFERDGVPADSFYLYRSLDGGESAQIAEVEGLQHMDFVEPGYNNACYKLQSYFLGLSGCTSDFSAEACVILTSVNRTEPDMNNYVKIYPNPASDAIFIESPETVEKVEVFAGTGVKVLRWYGGQGDKETGRQGEGNVVRVPLTGFPPGLYLVRVETASGVSTGKVVVK